MNVVHFSGKFSRELLVKTVFFAAPYVVLLIIKLG